MTTVREDRLRIGEVAHAAGVNVQTLRYYERQGLLPIPHRTPSGYRMYGAQTVDTLRAIKRSQALGFTLRDIRQLMAIFATAGRDAMGPPLDRWHSVQQLTSAS